MTAILRFTSSARDFRAHLGVLALGLAVVACGSSGPAAPKTGSLVVAVTAPSSVTPSISVTGPNSYTQAVTATTTLTGLAAGSYTVTATSVTGSNAIVGTLSAAVVSGSPASVSVGSPDTVTVKYATRGGSGGLWVANFDGSTAVEYTASQLAATGSGPAATAVATGVTNLNYGVAFDANGNLWVSTYLNDSILEFSASDLAKSGSPAPTVVIRDSIAGHSSPGAPLGIAFDADGNLWVADYADEAIEEYTSSQLSSSGEPSPAVVISASGSSTIPPSAVAFDSTGNLWVSYAPIAPDSSRVVEFIRSQLTTSGSLTPNVTLKEDPADSSIYGALSLAFDASGNLWVSNGNENTAGPNTVVMFSPSQLVTNGDPAPAVILRPSSGSLVGPSGLAFDASGDLWVANLDGSTVVEYAASQLVSSGSPTPNATISGTSLAHAAGIAFDPHAAALPVRPALRAPRKTQ